MVDNEDGAAIIVILFLLVFGIPLVASGQLGSGIDYNIFDDNNASGDSGGNSDSVFSQESSNNVYVSSDGVSTGVESPFSGVNWNNDISINEAMNDIEEGSKVVFVDERVEIDETIRINKSITLVGEGSKVVPSPDDGPSKGIIVEDGSNLTIRDVEFSGFSRAIDVESDAAKFSLINVTLSNSTIGLYIDGSFNDWFIRNSTVVNNTQGILVINSDNDWFIIDSDIRENKYGLNIQKSSSSWKVIYTNITLNEYGVRITSSDGRGEITNSNLHSNSEYSVWMSGNDGSIKFDKNYWKGSSNDQVISDSRVLFNPCETPYCE